MNEAEEAMSYVDHSEDEGNQLDKTLASKNCLFRMQQIQSELEAIKNKLERLRFFRENIEELRNSGRHFTPPNIELSGAILVYSQKDVDRLIKLLFTLSNKKEYLLPILDSDVEEMIRERTIHNAKVDQINFFLKSLKTISSLVYQKLLREGDDRVYTRLDYSSKHERELLRDYELQI